MSCSKFLIPGFIKKNNISLDGIEVPEKGFYSFNDFFKRKKLKISYDNESNHFISPCDGLLSVVKLKGSSFFRVKNTEYDLAELLKDKRLSEEFAGGIGLIFRLTPAHYHRYVFVDGGKLSKKRRINGILHCVRPVAVSKFPVYVENSREYVVIETENFGKIVQMEVGAIMVGKITNHSTEKKVSRGMEKGYFEFGGSTIIVLAQKGRVKLSGSLLPLLKKGKEVPVCCGECIGVGNVED